MTDRSNRDPESFRLAAQAARAELAADPQRPRYHFTAPRNWLNDPNGLIQWKGTYHLFYQHDPDSPLHGLMHWGHASSPDLVHWRDLPVAIAPTPGSVDEDGIFSGGAVDANGTPMAFYSGIQGPSQLVCAATSDDDLIEWTKDPANPLIASVPTDLDLLRTDDGTIHYRDPSVWRDGDAWWMTVGSGITGVGGTVLLYRSADLKAWDYVGPLLTGDASQREPVWLGTMWECPQLFRLGDRHVLLISVWHERRTLYTAWLVGTFADGRFTPEHVDILDPGSFYAPQTLADDRGRRIMIGWLREQRDREAMAASGWNGAMTVPWVLTLGNDHRLRYHPAVELEALRADHRRVGDVEVPSGEPVLLPDLSGDCLELGATIDPGSATSFGLVLRRSPDGAEETRIVYEPGTGDLYIDRTHSSQDERADTMRHTARLTLGSDEPLRLRVFLDRSIVELVANERVMLSERIYPTREDSLGVGVFAEGGSATLAALECWTMRGF